MDIDFAIEPLRRAAFLEGGAGVLSVSLSCLEGCVELPFIPIDSAGEGWPRRGVDGGSGLEGRGEAEPFSCPVGSLEGTSDFDFRFAAGFDAFC